MEEKVEAHEPKAKGSAILYPTQHCRYALALAECGHKRAVRGIRTVALSWGKRQCSGAGVTAAALGVCQSSIGIARSAQGLCEGVPEAFRGRNWRL